MCYYLLLINLYMLCDVNKGQKQGFMHLNFGINFFFILFYGDGQAGWQRETVIMQYVSKLSTVKPSHHLDGLYTCPTPLLVLEVDVGD